MFDMTKKDATNLKEGFHEVEGKEYPTNLNDVPKTTKGIEDVNRLLGYCEPELEEDKMRDLLDNAGLWCSVCKRTLYLNPDKTIDAHLLKREQINKLSLAFEKIILASHSFKTARVAQLGYRHLSEYRLKKPVNDGLFSGVLYSNDVYKSVLEEIHEVLPFLREQLSAEGHVFLSKIMQIQFTLEHIFSVKSIFARVRLIRSLEDVFRDLHDTQCHPTNTLRINHARESFEENICLDGEVANEYA